MGEKKTTMGRNIRILISMQATREPLIVDVNYVTDHTEHLREKF